MNCKQRFDQQLSLTQRLNSEEAQRLLFAKSKSSEDGCQCMENKVTESNYSSESESQRSVTPIEESRIAKECASTYCKKIKPERQMSLIRDILIQENSGDERIIMNKADRGVTHQRKYLIDAKWWRKWCDYSGFNQVTDEPKINIDHN